MSTATPAAIGNMQLFSWESFPLSLIGIKSEDITKPGQVGASYRFEGIRGEVFEAVSVHYGTATAAAYMQGYTAMQGSVVVVTNDDGESGLVFVEEVRLAEWRRVGVVVGAGVEGANARCKARWRLRVVG